MATMSRNPKRNRSGAGHRLSGVILGNDNGYAGRFLAGIPQDEDTAFRRDKLSPPRRIGLTRNIDDPLCRPGLHP
ncbi:hypothetical protein [Cupriavidus necator]|uniref:hypothetical protein n=1 Tax=Cupriavidus necator TaxID=106590 RepID=UPI0030F39374